VPTNICSAGALADLFGLNIRTVQALSAKGVLVKIAHGRYDERASIKSYVAHLREQAAGRMGTDPTGPDIVSASATLKTEQAALARTRRMILEGSLIDVSRILPAWQRTARAIRQACLAIPSRCRSRLPHWSAFDAGIVEEEIREVLTQLGTNPPPFDDADVVEA
jgi:phage terminase Nu1 subunit (DNA packaging protein)